MAKPYLSFVLPALLSRRRLLLVVFALLAAAMLPGVARLETDNSPRAFFLHGSPRVAAYERFQARFGNDQLLRMAVSGPGLWTPQGVAWRAGVERRIEAVPGVEAVLGSSAGLLALPAGDGSATLAARTLADPLARQLGWVDEAGEVATALVVVDAGASGRELLERLRRLSAAAPTGITARWVGLPVLDEALDGSSREIERRFFPLLVLFTVLLLAVTLRRAAAVAVPLVFVAFVEVVTLGLMGYLGVELNLVLAVVPPLVFVIALATAVHLLVRFRELRNGAPNAYRAMVETVDDKGWAVVWTGLTTAAGFGSLAVSRVGPVRELGIWTALGVAVMTAAAFTLYPLLLTGWVRGVRSRGLTEEARSAGHRLAAWAARRRTLILAAAAALSALALAGVPRLAVESNALAYLERDHPARRGIEELERRGIGSAVVELELVWGAQPGTGEPAGRARPERSELLERHDRLARRLRAQPLVLGAVGPADLVAAARRRGLPVDLGTSPLAGAALAPYLGPDAVRLTLFTPTVGYRRLEPLLAAAHRAAGEIFPDATVELTGEYPLLLEAQRQLLSTLALSLTLTVLAVAVILRAVLGSTRLTALAMLPNLWPVAGVLGIMGWSGAPLDVATVMVGSVVLGLAVDDTLHTLGHFRELAPRLGRLEAVAGTLAHTLAAYLLTGAILGAGFGVCALSRFAPTARFGALSALGIGLALLGDVFLLPALLGSTPRGALAKLARRRSARS